eukprot:1716992-Pleurochrysis_carterae.AAC.2
MFQGASRSLKIPMLMRGLRPWEQCACKRAVLFGSARMSRHKATASVLLPCSLSRDSAPQVRASTPVSECMCVSEVRACERM